MRDDVVTDSAKGGGDGLHTHPHSPFTAVPVEEKQDRQPINVSEGQGFFVHFLHLTAGTVNSQSLHYTAL